MLELTIISPYLIVDSEFSFPSPLQRERSGRVGKVSPIGWAHSYLSAINGATNSKRESTRSGRTGVGADFMSSKIHFIGHDHWQTLAGVDFNPTS
jgi:hypothetical protein